MSGAGSSIPLEPYHDVEEKDHLLNTTEDDDGLNEFTIEDAPRRQEFVNIQSRGHSVVTCAVFLLACLRDAIPPFSITGILWFLVPSFLSGSNPPKKPLHPTAYLDGMRGVAAFTVLIYHLSYTPWFTELGWGTQGKNHEFWRLPIIRLVYSGSMGVSLFFLISGYALSYRPLKLLRSGKTLEGHQALASTLLRRWARLFLPTAVSTFIVFCLIRFGAYEPLRHIINQKKYFRYHIEMMPMRHKTFWEQFFHWMGQQRKIWNPIAIRGEGIVYDTHLWTIAYEFRNSLYVFLTILGTSRLQTRYRITLVCLINLYLWSFARWDLVLFLTGMILAEWDLIRGAHLPPSALPIHRSATQRRSWKMVAFWTAASLVSLFLMSVPDAQCAYAPGYRTLCRLATWKGSQNRWWHAISATLWAITVSRVPLWKRFYESDIVQYLGRISYAMYLVHGMTYKSFGLNLEYWMWKNVTGTQGANRFLGFMLAACVTIPFCIWWADIFWRLVDIPAVRFTKWLEGKVTKKD